MSTKDVIQRHREDVLAEHSFKSAYRITVRRSHILDDALTALRTSFDERKHIRVRFLGEPAVDEGGPRREFFMLLMGAIANNSSLLDGPPNHRVLRHNTSAFQVIVTQKNMNADMHMHEHAHMYTHKNTCAHQELKRENSFFPCMHCSQDEMYMYIGRMVALSILHGGPGPVFFAPVVIDYLQMHTCTHTRTHVHTKS